MLGKQQASVQSLTEVLMGGAASRQAHSVQARSCQPGMPNTQLSITSTVQALESKSMSC